MESAGAIIDVIDISGATYWQFQHGSRRRIQTKVGLTVPLPAKAKWNAEVMKSLVFLDIGLAAACIGG